MNTPSPCYITAQDLLQARFPSPDERPTWDTAVLCFRDHPGSLALVRELRATPVARHVFWGPETGSERPGLYETVIADKRICILPACIWGGPQAAILVEELAALGVRTLLGWGAVGSFHDHLPRGTQVTIETALLTDGTSVHYADTPVQADPDLLRLTESEGRVTAVTMDALYRETPELVQTWRDAGAHAVCLEAAPFYAAAQHTGTRALWIGHVSDQLLGTWLDWRNGRRDMTQTSIERCIRLLQAIETS